MTTRGRCFHIIVSAVSQKLIETDETFIMNKDEKSSEIQTRCGKHLLRKLCHIFQITPVMSVLLYLSGLQSACSRTNADVTVTGKSKGEQPGWHGPWPALRHFLVGEVHHSAGAVTDGCVPKPNQRMGQLQRWVDS